MTEAVLDSSAILAAIMGEPGAEEVFPLIGRAAVLTVNYTEVATKLIDRGASRLAARAAILGLRIEVVPFDFGLAERVAELRPLTRHRGLSLGDRACLALAEREGVPAITADRSWAGVLPGLDIRVIR